MSSETKAPQPPAEAQPVEWQVRLVRKSDESVFRDWFSIDKQRYESEKGGSEGDSLRCEYRELYAAPPSAPVGVVDVDALAQEIRRVDGEHSLGASALAEALVPYLARTTLAQQPASDGGFTAADMMDARQEGRKEVQQPAAFNTAVAPAHTQGSVEQQPVAVDGPWDELRIIVKDYLDDPHADAEYVLREIAVLVDWQRGEK